MRCIVALLVLSLVAVNSWAQNKPGPQTLDEQIEQMLRQQFDRMDKNKDGNIDPEEAAKFFRGPNAKPAPELLNKPTGGGNPFADKNLLEPAKPEDKPGDKPANKPAAKPVVKPMDVQFFEAVDSNQDNLVSWEEYSTYFRTLYEAQFREYQKLMQEMHQLQQRMARATGAQLQAMRRQMSQLQQLQRRQLQQFQRQFGNPQFRRLPRR
jgi:Ca2+-binding EF-hand superfamily protein